MDRQTLYPGQILPETSLLQIAKDSMIGLAKLSAALLGTSSIASGFATTPTSPASLQIVVGPGELYTLTSIDATAWSTLAADTTHSIMKQGIALDATTLNCPAPGTTGQSINYLVEVAYQDLDSAPVLLPYYNSSNPSQPYSGMGNNGLTQNTVRKGAVAVQVKAGAAAATGSQVTPAPDVGYIGLYVVTVAFGQTTIASGNITAATGAPLINSTLHGLSPIFTSNLVVPPAVLPAHAMQLGQATGRLLNKQIFSTAGTFTYTPTAGTKAVSVRLVGGGGAGAGAAATASTTVSIGAGGCAGSYAEGYFTSGFSGVTITVGSGGAGRLGLGGFSGGTTSFGALIAANGGSGGGTFGPTAPPLTANTQNSIGGTSGGYVGIFGGSGVMALAVNISVGYGGQGANSPIGSGGAAANGAGNGTAASGYGSGGGGCLNLASASATTGGVGSGGVVIVEEYA